MINFSCVNLYQHKIYKKDKLPADNARLDYMSNDSFIRTSGRNISFGAEAISREEAAKKAEEYKARAEELYCSEEEFHRIILGCPSSKQDLHKRAGAATELLKKAVELDKIAYGKKSNEVIDSYFKIASNLMLLGKDNESLKYWNNFINLRIDQKLAGHDSGNESVDEELATALSNKADILVRKKQYNKALELYNEASSYLTSGLAKEDIRAFSDTIQKKRLKISNYCI